MTDWLPWLFARLPAGVYTKLLVFVTAWAEGQAMTLEQAIEYALTLADAGAYDRASHR